MIRRLAREIRALLPVSRLLQLDPEFVNDKVRQHSGRLLARFFPEIRSIDDARDRLRAD